MPPYGRARALRRCNAAGVEQALERFLALTGEEKAALGAAADEALQTTHAAGQVARDYRTQPCCACGYEAGESVPPGAVGLCRFAAGAVRGAAAGAGRYPRGAVPAGRSRQSRYTLSAGTVRGGIYDAKLRPLVNESTKTLLAVDPTPAAVTALRQHLSAEDFAEVYPLLQGGHPLLVPGNGSAAGEGITRIELPQRYGTHQPAPHIIGYTDGEGHGVCGVEAGYDARLTRWGGEITVRYTVNAWQQAVGVPPQVNDPADRTAGIVLTLDRTLQAIAEQEAAVLGRGAVVLMEVETGAIRAMCSAVL